MNQTDAREPAPPEFALDPDPGAAGTGRRAATGRRAVAGQILMIASAHGAIVREDTDLVALLDSLELESPIPPVVFATVAEIVSYLHRADGHATRTPKRPVAAQELAW